MNGIGVLISLSLTLPCEDTAERQLPANQEVGSGGGRERTSHVGTHMQTSQPPEL